MKHYQKPASRNWTGRSSSEQLYWHEKVQCIDLTSLPAAPQDATGLAFLGYACDEGVRRNQGRVGAKAGPDAIRKALSRLANHFPEELQLIDAGDSICSGKKMEEAQETLSEAVVRLLTAGWFPIVLGGGHDMSYGHARGVAQFLEEREHKTLGIINLDAHLDLRTPAPETHSGTPFYQLSQELSPFHYLCLGVQRQANHRGLFQTAEVHDVTYLENQHFHMGNLSVVDNMLHNFLAKVDQVYLTIDLDGFTSAIAPGVSAPSPFGFDDNMALHVIRRLCQSQKLISMDLAELNPKHDLDGQTARLAAGLIYHAAEWKYKIPDGT